MLARDHRLHFAIAIAISVCAWTATARAATTMTPGTLTTLTTSPGVVSEPATGTLSSNDSGNRKVVLDLVESSCTGEGTGTFDISPLSAQLTSPVTITVTYDPGQSTGPRSCTVNVYAEGTSSNPLTTFTVTGDSGDPPMIALGTVNAFPPVRAFDNAVAATSSTRSINVSNGGDRPLIISDITVTGDFTLDASTPQTSAMINGGGSRSWTIRFNPSAIGTRTGTIQFFSNAGNPMASLTGDGTSGAFTLDAAPSNGDFDQVAAGQSATIDFSIAHSGNAPRGVLTFDPVAITNATQPWFSITGQPTTLTSGTNSGTVTIRCAPPIGATQTATADITVSADSDGSSGPSFRTQITRQVTCQGGASVLALAPSASVEFPPTLVGSPATPVTVMLENSGTAMATVQFSSTSANRDRFSVTGPGGCGVSGAAMTTCSVPAAVGSVPGSIALTLTFAPIAEGSVGASFTISTGGGGGPTNSVSLSGRGIDRKIVVPDVIQVPDTFRNPGSKATRAPVTLVNMGEYPVTVTELMMNGEPVWSIVDQTVPFEIPGLMSRDVMVEFAPQSAGKADDGQLLILNDDPKVANGMPIVLLSGNGKDRNVDMSLTSVDVGDTFAGVPTRLSITRPSDMLVIENKEEPDAAGTTNFTIRSVSVEGDHAEMFEVVDRDGQSVAGRELPAGSTLQLDVIFKPTYVGEFQAILALYLDEDQEDQFLVVVRGRALFIDAGGSGGFGCQTTRGAGGAMLLVMAALLLVLRRRRR